MLKKIVAAGAAAIMLAVCVGCGGSPDDASQIRTAQQDMVVAFKDNNMIKFCSYMTEPGECLAGVTMAKAFLGDGEFGDLIPSDVDIDDEVEKIKIQVSKDGKHATVDGLDWIKQDGEWKSVYDTTR
jgi:hypothetical protein